MSLIDPWGYISGGGVSPIRDGTGQVAGARSFRAPRVVETGRATANASCTHVAAVVFATPAGSRDDNVAARTARLSG